MGLFLRCLLLLSVPTLSSCLDVQRGFKPSGLSLFMRHSNTEQKAANIVKRALPELLLNPADQSDNCKTTQGYDTKLASNTHRYTFNDLSGSVTLAWVGDASGVILALTTFQVPFFLVKLGQSKLYRSENYGKSFEDVTSLINNTFIRSEYGIAIGNSGKVILTAEVSGSYGSRIFVSSDFGRSFTPRELSFIPMMQIVYNPENSSVLLVLSNSNELWLSEDFGTTWKGIHNRVCLVKWGRKNSIFFSGSHNGSCSDRGMLDLRRTTDYGKTFKTVASKIYSFGLGGRFLFASVMTGKGTLRMIHVSVDHGDTWNMAQLPPVGHEQFYSILAANDDMVFMHVDEPGDTGFGTIYVSDDRGTVYSKSLERHLYTTTGGDTDFTNVTSLRGVFITSMLAKDNSVQSVVSFDQGGEWVPLRKPANTKCDATAKDPDKCSLHIHASYSIAMRLIVPMLPLSEPNAVGLILAHGSVGDSISVLKPDVYVSDDGGYTWMKALKGPHHYAILDSGGLLVAVEQTPNKPINQIKFSTDEGQCWGVYNFTKDPIFFTGLASEPGARSMNVSIWGYSDAMLSMYWVSTTIDFRELLTRDCGDKDYVQWLAHSDDISDPNDGCMLGYKEKFLRLRKSSVCWNGRDYKLNTVPTPCSLDIKEAFQRAQKGHNNKAKLVASLNSRYNKLEDKTLFHEEFVHYLKYAMIVYKREPTVENVMEFVARFATSFQPPPKTEEEEQQEDKEEEEEEEEDAEDDHPFLSFLFNFLLESHKASSHAVRFRVCQLINKLLGSMAENAQIDDDLFDHIHQAMLVRVTDKFPNVRIQAALAMTRLQQPKDPDCPTINAYMLILENDSNAEVRRAVLSCIAMSPRTLPKVLKRTRDIKENVRKLAYQVLADKVHIKAMTIAQRVNLLQQGLHDTSEAVREVVCSRVLPAWLLRLDGNVIDLLHRLDVENCSQTALDTLKAIFKGTPTEELLQNDTQLDNRKLIPADSLSCENVLYWRALCEFIKAKGDDADEMLEKVLPDAATYAEYLSGYLKAVPLLSEEQRADFNQLELVMTKEFISQQLIHLIGCLDTNEEGGRKRVSAVLQEMLALPQTPSSLVSLLTEKLLTLIPDDHRRIQTVAEIISDVREPIMEASQPVDQNMSRRQQVQLAEVKVRILEAKQSLEDCITAQDFGRAAELKDSITELENRRNQIIQEVAESSQPIDKEVRAEKNDPETLLRCLTMCAELLKQMSIKTRIGPTISALMSSLVLPSIANAHPAVRNMAVVCLGTCTLHSKDLAKTHMVLLLQIAQLDEVKIRISALRAIIDLLLLFGFQLLSETAATQTAPLPQSPDSQEEDAPVAEEKGDAPEDTAQSILVMLSEFLDSEVSDLRTETAEGLAKLMYTGRISSAKMLSRLVLLWYNPVTEDDTRLRHCLGVFFQLYARESRAHQEILEEGFLPTVRTLMNAPATSPLAEVDINNVVELLVELTRPSALIKPSTNTEEAVSVHDYMAVRMCGEMLKDPTAPEVRLYAKTLSNLELTRDETVRKDLQALLQQLVQVVKDRVCLRALEKIIYQLVDSKEQAELLSASALQPLDVNADEAATDDPSKSAKRAKRGQRRVCTAKGRRPSRRAESSEESDGENVPEAVSLVRPSRRAKTAALEKTKLDLNPLINQEANVS